VTIEPYATASAAGGTTAAYRPTGLPRSTAPVSAVQGASVCPKCGRSGYDCCEYDDRILISPEGQARAMALASPQDAQKTPSPEPEQQATGNSDSAKPNDPASPSLTSAAVDPTAKKENGGGNETETGSDADRDHESTEHGSRPAGASHSGELSKDEQKEVDDLKKRDQEVHQHEAAHKAAAGQLAVGGPNYTYKTGPDGEQYATGGEVKIAVGSGRTPEEKLKNAEQASRAALAPAKPSGQDRQVAAEAQSVAMDAQREINQEQAKGTDRGKETSQATSAQAAVDSGNRVDRDEGQDDALTKSSTAQQPSTDSDHDGDRDAGESSDTPLVRALSRAAAAYQRQAYPQTMSLGESW